MKRTLAAALLLFAAACASATPAPSGPAPLDPVGVFPFTTMANGREVTGSVEVTGQPGAYGGAIRTSVTADMPITGVRVSGQEMVISADTPDGPLTLTMTFAGDTFAGGWELGGDSGALSGRRTP